MRPLFGNALPLVALLALAACVVPGDDTWSGNGNGTGYGASVPRNAASITIEGAEPTAVGETAHVRIIPLDETGYPLSSYDFESETPTCSTPGCVIEGSHERNIFNVRCDAPTVAAVSVVVHARPTRTVDIPISFRNVTKLVIERSLLGSPAGSAFAMVPGDRQTWFVSAADDDGPLVVAASAFTKPTASSIGYSKRALECSADDTTENARRYGASRLRCSIGSDTPDVLRFNVAYRDVVRDETVHVVPLTAVRAASLLSCAATSHRAGDRAPSYFVPDLFAIEERALPCAEVTSVRYPSSACAEGRDRTLVPQLVLEDGTVARGGAKFLVVEGSDYDVDIDRISYGPGVILGRFGTALLSVPFSVDGPCR